MSDTVRIELLPRGEVFHVGRGTPLQDVLFARGVEFPCGGRAQCRGCRIKLLEGRVPITSDQQRMLSAEQLADGWRLACRATADGDLTLEIAQWQTTILVDNSAFEFTPRDGLGAVVDLGTTTLVAQLLDLRTGRVLAVRTELNPQARHGADVMSRVQFAVAENKQSVLEKLIREEIGRLIGELTASAGGGQAALRDVVIVGNTVMHHLFCGMDLEPMSHFPFEAVQNGLQSFRAADLGWSLPGEPDVRFLPCLGGFVGSDILAGILATKLHQSKSLVGLIDLGTNGEIAIGNREKILCASTAAGPAFEGARIAAGMRAATGAISQVQALGDRLECVTVGHVPPRGICGSGLVDAVAACLELGWIEPSGRIADRSNELTLAPPVTLTQCDIRELQLAKGAIAAGARILLDILGATADDVPRLYLAGAFGNYVNRVSARRIGLINFPSEKVRPAGNTALLGAKLALFDPQDKDKNYPQITSRIQHVSLADHPRFQDIFAEEMTFPP